MKHFFWIFCLVFPTVLLGQNSYTTVIAQRGDGIFSILRKEGLNPAKYYAEFVALNEENLRNGSELHLGRTYRIPLAEDSFKKTGINIALDSKEEGAIFEEELAQLNHKSEKLKDAVIYLISGSDLLDETPTNNRVTEEINKRLAKELIVHGAKVYVISSEKKTIPTKSGNLKNDTSEGAMADLAQMQDYLGTINKKFLQHPGKYQRLLITRVKGEITDTYCDVSIYHHVASKDGKRIANNIQNLFQEQSITRKTVDQYKEIFTDKHNLYLAKNALPAITLIELETSSEKSLANKNTMILRSNKALFTDLIANGVLNDYAELNLQD